MSAARIRAAYQRIDRERRAALARRMSSKPMSVDGVVKRLHDDGAAWLETLGRPRGVDVEDVAELSVIVGEDAARNMGALVRVGGITLEQGIMGGTGAGVGVALLIGVDIGRRDRAEELRQVLEAVYVDGHRDAGDLERAVEELLDALGKDAAA